MYRLLTIIVYYVLFRNSEKFKRWTCITIITVLFVLQPSLTTYCLKIFKCVNVGNGISKVEMDIQTDCWSAIHLKWIFSLSVPMLLVYVIGAPLLAFFVLFKNRKNLDKPEIIKYILLLYQGLRHERYYWELVNTLRKCTLLGLQVFIPDSYTTVKALVGVLVLFICALMQARLNPFKISVISRLEHREMMASLLTLYGGLIFIQPNSQLQGLAITFYVIILLVNARFLILWVFCMLTIYKSKKYPGMAALYIKRMFCLVVDEIDEDKLCYKSKLTTESLSKTNQIFSIFCLYLSYKIFEQNNLESANATKKTILQNKTGTIVRTENRLDSAVNQSVRHGLNDSQRDDEMQSIRTPKRLLIKSKRAKNVESTNSNLKSGLIKSSHLRKKARKKNRKTVKGTDEVVAISPEENTNFSYFGKDFVRPKNYKTGQNHQKDSSFNKKEFSKPMVRKLKEEPLIEEQKEANEIDSNEMNFPQTKELWKIYKVNR